MLKSGWSLYLVEWGLPSLMFNTNYCLSIIYVFGSLEMRHTGEIMHAFSCFVN